jgi:hypothetical protein
VKSCVLSVQVEVTTILDRGDRPVDVGSDKLSSKWLCLTRDKHTEGSDKVESGFPLEAESKELIPSKKNNVPAPLSMDSEEETRTNVSARGKGKVEVANNWTMLEMGLYEKGLQIFGKNRYRNWNILICQIQMFHLSDSNKRQIWLTY